MLLTTAVALGLLGYLSQPPGRVDAGSAPARAGVYKQGPWLIAVNPDRFTGTTGCQLHSRDVTLQRGTLVFRVASHGDTTAAVFRVDAGPPRPLAEAFDTLEAHGFFPQRGWLVDPNGGEAALPVSYVTGARAVAIRVWPHAPRRFDVAGLQEAEAKARALGCAI
jgi:hypothetical protein